MSAPPAATPPAPTPEAPSAERARGYGRWKGDRSAQAWRWWVIARANLSLAWGSIWVKVLLVASLIPGVMVAAITYFFLPLSPAVLGGLMSGCVLFTFLVAALVGTRMIAEDRRMGAFLAHFARPVTKADYVAGKLVALFLPLLFVTTASALIALGADAAVTNETFVERLQRESGGRAFDEDAPGSEYLIRANYGKVLQAVFSWGFIVSLTTASLVLGISALAERTRTAGVVWFAIVALGAAAQGILQEALEKDWPALLSWNDNVADLGSMLLGLQGEGLEFALWQRAGLLVLAGAAGLAVVYLQVKRAEEGAR